MVSLELAGYAHLRWGFNPYTFRYKGFYLMAPMNHTHNIEKYKLCYQVTQSCLCQNIWLQFSMIYHEWPKSVWLSILGSVSSWLLLLKRNYCISWSVSTVFKTRSNFRLYFYWLWECFISRQSFISTVRCILSLSKLFSYNSQQVNTKYPCRLFINWTDFSPMIHSRSSTGYRGTSITGRNSRTPKTFEDTEMTFTSGTGSKNCTFIPIETFEERL